ncbi:UNVERIFIED_CONTAM: hypothetical protein B566_EDAN018667 [Ephemera danica]|nr:hypothetical protein B566_EDAN018667 [Ephemera danica]
MNCQTSLKPTVERACSEQPCGPEWFMADWGSCSHGCGTGSQRREVRCLDEAYRPSSSCTQELRPTIHRACNTHACERGHSDVGDRSSSNEDEQNAVAPRERLHARAHHNVVPAASTSSHHGSHLQAHDAHEDSGGAGPDCVDKFPNCNLVVQARLCKYKYYRNACCVACHRKSG